MSVDQFNFMLKEYKGYKNPVLLSNIFNTLLDKLKTLQIAKQQKDLYDFLIDKCINEEDSEICESAAVALTLQKIVSDEDITIGLISAIPYTKNINAPIKALTIICLRSETQYTTFSVQHPIIKFIKHSPQSLEYILNIIYSTDPEQLEKYEAVLLYIIIGHDYKLPDKMFGTLWDFLSKNDRYFERLSTTVCAAMFQLTHKNGIEKSLNFLQAELSRDGDINTNDDQTFLSVDRTVFILSTMLNEALKHDIASAPILQTLKRTASNQTQYQCADLIILELAEIALVIPSIYVGDLIDIFSNITKNSTVYNNASKIFVETILKWKLFPLLGETGINIDFVYLHGQKCDILSEQLEDDLATNKHYCNAYQIMELLDLPDEALLSTMNDFDSLTSDFLREYAILFVGVLSSNNRGPELVVKAVDLLSKLCDTYKELTSTLLAIIISKLSLPLDPTVHFKLLKTLPKMGSRKENLRHIILTMKHIAKSKDTHMKGTALSLMYDLWCADNSCYKLLQELLFEEHPDNIEFNTTRAFVLKELCRKKPHLYYMELLPFLSKILNESNTENTLPVILVLEGLSHLVVNDLIQIDTIWTSIKPRFQHETNLQILQSFFKWISALNEVHSEDEKTKNTLVDAAAVLWNAVLKYKNTSLIKAAFIAMKSFSLEVLSIAMPEIFTKGLNLDNFLQLSGQCWLNVLQHLPNRDSVALFAAADMLISLVHKEIAGYRPTVYMIGENTKLEGKREPIGFKTLPNYSILVYVSEYVRQHCSPEHLATVDPIMVQCLRVLAGDSSDSSNDYTKENTDTADSGLPTSCYSRSLPPHSWTFLQELIYVEEYKPLVLDIACHQVGVSGSARRLIENYLLVQKEIDEDDSILLSRVNLLYLCNSIQPSVLQPFLANGIVYCCQIGISELEQLISNYVYIMTDVNTSESNKYSLMNIAKEYLTELNAEDKITEILLPLISRVPDTTLDEYFSMDNGQINERNNRIKVYAMIKCQRVINSVDSENPFKHLDTVLDSQKFLDFDGKEEFLCSYLEEIYPKVSTKSIITFLVNLMGKVEVFLADDGKISLFIIHYCEIFIKTVVYLSQYRKHICFRNSAGCIHFGHALQTLARKTDWTDLMPQVLEWIWYITKKLNDSNCNKQQNDKSKFCRMTLRYGLYTLRSEPCYVAKWPKYLETAHDMLTDWISN